MTVASAAATGSRPVRGQAGPSSCGWTPWAEAARRPVLRATSARLNLAWAALLDRTIGAGVTSGIFHCTDPRGAAWRILSLVDGFALQVIAHRTTVDRADMLAWATRAAEQELELSAGSLGNGARRAGAAARPP